MAFSQKDNSGSLFRNDKRASDNHPNLTGSALVNGVPMWVSAWTKEGAKGKWISLAFKPKEPKEGAAKKPAPKEYISEPDEDSIPF